jgi:hypothetical protein
MPSTLVEFIEKDEIVEEELEEFEKGGNCRYELFILLIFFHHLLIYLVHHLL